MNSQISRSLFVSCVCALSFSCSKGNFQSTDAGANCSGSGCSSPNNTNLGNSPDAGTAGAAEPDLSQIQGAISGAQSGANGFLAVGFDKAKGQFTISIPLPNGLAISTRGSISKLPGATFTTSVDANGKSKLTLSIPAEYVLKGVKFLPPATLPNGDALPAMPAGQGELPALAVQLPSGSSTSQFYLYIGVNAVAVYVTLPSSFKIPFDWTFPIFNKDKSRKLGYFTYVGPKLNAPPGVFVSSLIPADVAHALEEYLGF